MMLVLGDEGWACPPNTNRWHFIRNNHSLCSRWSLFEYSVLYVDDYPDRSIKCKTCRKMREKEIAE